MATMHAALVIQSAINPNKLMLVKLARKKNPHWFFRGEIPRGVPSPTCLGLMLSMLGLPDWHLSQNNCTEVQHKDFYVAILVVKVNSLEDLTSTAKPGEGCAYVIVDQADIGATADSDVLTQEVDLQILIEARRHQGLL